MVTRQEAIKKLKADPLLFFRKQASLVSKSGKETFFNLNEAQQIIHSTAEKMLRETGKIRLVIPKGRQMGCTTYIRQRFLHKVCYNKGLNAKIMTHTHDASKGIFAKIRDTYEGINDKLKPIPTKNNEKELVFNIIKSQISIATAGAKGTGRSATLQLFHGSECAFWDNADDHMRGMLQAVSGENKSEVFLESTANGMTGDAEQFYNKVMAGYEKNSDFKTLFLPWFIMSEYQKELPSDFKLQTYQDYCEIEYKQRNNISDKQIYWMRQKIATDFDNRFSMFCVEYPSNIQEAFEGTGEDSFIEPALVALARKREFKGVGDKILGLDVGGDEHSKNPDRSVITLKQGNDFKTIFIKKGISRNSLLQTMSDYVKQYKPQKIRIDITGIGHNMDVDLVTLCNQRNIPIADCQGVNFGSEAVNSQKFTNVRAEMYHWLRETLKIGCCDDDANLQKDLTALSYKRDKNRRLQMESKKNITQSPDLADSMALCCHQGTEFYIGAF